MSNEFSYQDLVDHKDRDEEIASWLYSLANRYARQATGQPFYHFYNGYELAEKGILVSTDDTHNNYTSVLIPKEYIEADESGRRQIEEETQRIILQERAEAEALRRSVAKRAVENQLRQLIEAHPELVRELVDGLWRL